MQEKRSAQRGASQVLTLVILTGLALALALGVLREVASAVFCGTQRAAVLIAGTRSLTGALCEGAATSSPTGDSEGLTLTAGGKKPPKGWLKTAEDWLRRFKEKSGQKSGPENKSSPPTSNERQGGPFGLSSKSWDLIDRDVKELVLPVRKAWNDERRDPKNENLLESLEEAELQTLQKNAEGMLARIEQQWEWDRLNLGRDAPFDRLSRNKADVQAVIDRVDEALKNRNALKNRKPGDVVDTRDEPHEALERSRTKWKEFHDKAKNLADPVREALQSEGRDGMSNDVQLSSHTVEDLGKLNRAAEDLRDGMMEHWRNDLEVSGKHPSSDRLSALRDVEMVIRVTTEALENRRRPRR